VDHGILVARTQSDDSFAQAGIRGGRQTYLVGNSLMILGGDIIADATAIHQLDGGTRSL
jgi:hypothetical protein